MFDNRFFLFFFAALTFAAGASVCWYLVAWRLLKSGFRVKFFATPRDTLSMFRQYRDVAPRNGWSKLPVIAFWICAAAMFVAGIASAVTASAVSAAGAMRLSNPAVLAWVALSSFCFAIIFSYRVSRKLLLRERVGVPVWTQLRADASFRNDLYVTVIAWLGFLATASFLIARFGGK